MRICLTVWIFASSPARPVSLHFTFAALFKKAVGTTPHRHVQHLRLEAAKAMLRDTDKTTLDIAITCGFASASHLAAAFRRQFSQSPTEYRSFYRGFRLGLN